MAREVTFGERVRAARIAAGLTQEEAAEKAGMRYQALAKIERGATDNPTLRTIRAIAKALGVSVCELVE